MKRRLRGLLLGISGRYLMPLLLLILVMAVSTLNYFHQLRLIGASVQQIETTRLRERLGVEQTRLDVRLGNADSIDLQRIVGSMGLYDGLTAAFLEDGERRVLASLSRTDIGRPLDAVLKGRHDGVYLRELLGQVPPDAIDIRAVQGQPLLTAVVPLAGGLRLMALVDFGHALTVRQAEVRSQVLLVSLMALFAAACLAWLLHVMWFRRALHLADSLAAMGAGNLSVRTGLSGNDELAIIGRAADGMAQQLQTDRDLALRLTDLVARSPVVVFEWRNEPGWPVSYVSDSVAQWGYLPSDFFLAGSHFSDLLHPDDVGQVSAEMASYLLNGPDVYRQQYRIRSASGAWVWVDDRTTLERDAQGHVVSISGILLDITAQKEAERLQAEQSQLLRMFYDLPFLGMAISSPVNKRWLQVNDRLCEMLGYSREELLGMTWAEITVPGDLARNLELFGELIAGRRTGYQMAKRFVRKDGAIVQVDMDVRGARDSDGVLKQLFTTLQDVTARHQAEAALRDSDHRLREAQRIGRMGSWVRDIDSGKAYWSDEMYRIFDVDPQAFVPSVDSLLTHIHPEDQPKVVQAMELAKAHGGAYEAAIRTVPGDRMKHLRARGELEMEDGRPKRLVGTVIDVTDITLAERALQEKESLLAEAQAVARIGNWSIDLESRRATWSDELFRLLGYDPQKDEASIERFLRAVHTDDRDRVQAWVREAVVTQPNDVLMLEHRIERADGVRELEQRLRVGVDDEGRSVRLFGTAMDVTEQRAATRAMQDYKEMLEQAEALVKLGSWAGDVETQRLTISEQLFRNVGLDPTHQIPSDEQYIGRLHPEDRAKVVDDMQRIRKGEAVGELVFRTDPAWGPMRWMRRTVHRVLREAEGRPQRYIGTLLDITDAVEAERQLKHLNQELEQRVAERTEQLREANQELEAFSYTVSHDLKAPLRGIDGYSQLLVEDFAKELGPDGRDFVHRIRHGVQQMGDLIGDLLDYSKIERREMARDRVALLPLVEQIIEGYRADIDGSGAEVRCELDPFTLDLDREGMAVVLRNLVGNALKFSRERERPVIEIGSRVEAGRRILWVRDNGVGFDMKYHDRIFAIFQRLHRAEEFPGTGVGLALVTKAVQRMGGRVWAESVLGQGSTFYLEFPA